MNVFVDSAVCNALVTISLSAYSLEKKLHKERETKNIVELYNTVQKAREMVEEKIVEINHRREEK